MKSWTSEYTIPGTAVHMADKGTMTNALLIVECTLASYPGPLEGRSGPGWGA